MYSAIITKERNIICLRRRAVYKDPLESCFHPTLRDRNMANICTVFFSLLFVGLAVLVGLYLSQPVPDTLPEKHHSGMLFFAAAIKANYFLDFLVSYIGIGKKFDTFRRMSDWAAKMFAKEESSLHIQDIKIANVPVRIYTPKDFFNIHNSKRTGVVYFHGGGWTYGSVELYHPLTQSIAKELDAVFISVEMAPEFTFPAQFHDCRAVVETLLATGEQYGINTDRIVVSGDSAGGNLAAAVALKLKNEKKKPAAQILIYPALQFTDFKLPSFRNRGNIILSAYDVAYFWSNYITGSSNMASSFLANNHSLHLRHSKYFSYVGLPEKKPERTQTEPLREIPQAVVGALTDFRATPLMADDLTGLPKTMLITSEYDVLKDDGVLFKARLLDAGVQVAYFHYMTYHAYLALQSSGLFVSDAWRQAVHDIVHFIKEL